MEQWLPLIFLVVGLLIGFIGAWFLAKFKFSAQAVTADELSKKYVSKDAYLSVQEQADLFRDDLKEKEMELRTAESGLATAQESFRNLEIKLGTQQEDFNQLRQQSQVEFENIANRLLEEKSEKFVAQNQRQMQDVLAPLREKVKDFGENIDKKFLEEAKDLVSLKKEIEQLRDLNIQLSGDAQNLVSALKGDNKTQGDWGEFRLEMLLEKAGLINGIHYSTQSSYRDRDGNQKRPDFIINLPEDKHLVIDSKVSLVAYERFFNAENEEKRKLYLKQHCDSLRAHIKDLSSKNYQHLYQINSPDYLILFVPIEPAFSLAVQEDSRLFLDALDRNIVIVTTSTLLATMRTVSFIWKQEKQKRSVLEIARQSGFLYDKFVNFVEDLKAIGVRLDGAQNAYHDAMNKLTDARRPGDTLIGKAQKIKELGAKTSKSLPKEMIRQLADEEEEEEEIESLDNEMGTII
ncbi:MAG: DNA recombination protein RmuC [Paraglaciecola sp.]|jgi:DNA recombination protein RmuC